MSYKRKKLTIKDDEIIVYDYKNNKIQEIKVSDTKVAFIDVVFLEHPGYKHRKCMIVYIDFEPYDGMEYRSYWNKPNVLIIQNSKLIEFFKNILEDINLVQIKLIKLLMHIEDMFKEKM